MATQAVTAVCKLVYKWYNDGDVYDNRIMDGWCNDLSSYANWLAKYVDAKSILDRIFECYGESEYEDILKDLADEVLDETRLESLSKVPAVGSIYDCEGEYVFNEYDEEDDEEW